MPEQYEIDSGDCVSQIAYERGFAPETIWNSPENASLKSQRGDLNLLLPGDIVVIPDKKLKELSEPDKKLHQFRKKQVPAMLRLRLNRLEWEQNPGAPDKSKPANNDLDAVYEEKDETAKSKETPWAHCPYYIDIDGDVRQGSTDGDGVLKEKIPPNARLAKLTMDPGKPDEMIYMLELGATEPLATVPGIKRRLANLGFFVGDADDEKDDPFSFALSVFQSTYGLKVTGEPDQATQDKLKALHGC